MAYFSKFLDELYLHSPIKVQQVMVAIYGWDWYRKRYNSYFHQLVEEFKERDSWTAEQFSTYQENQLSIILDIAQRAPYYRKLFKRIGVRLQESPWQTLQLLPYLNKRTLRRNARNLLTTKHIPRNTMVFKSSGTTGTPTEIYYSPRFHALELAVPAVRNLGWSGVDYRQRRVMFGVRKVCRYDQRNPPFWRYSPFENMAYASVYHLSAKNVIHYVEFLRDFCPAIIMGYPSSLYTIARHALEMGELPPPAEGIFTTSETVTARIREALEATWKCKVFDRYGAVENCLFASQCEYGQYHISPEVGIVEIVDQSGKACPPGVTGEVICTGLQNDLQPLIRYKIGDMAKWSLQQLCPCGRSMPILEGVEGRFEDICRTPDGREILRFDTVFKGVDSIQEAQIIQMKIDEFIIKVVPDENFNDLDEKHLQQNMRLHVGDVNVIIELVREIKRTQNGKFRAVISKCQN